VFLHAFKRRRALDSPRSPRYARYVIEGATQPERRPLDPTERRTLVGCALVSGALLLAPRELVGAGICWVVTLGLGIWHVLQTRKESRAEAAAKALPEAALDPANATPSSD
jgi:hypothetical protein